MNLHPLYTDRIRLQFDLGAPLHHAPDFEYAQCEDDSFELFYRSEDSPTFVDWNRDLWPPDPRYGDPNKRRPLLHESFPALDVYGEQVLNFLLYTLNSTLSLPPIPLTHVMNERMKQHCFFQLGRMPAVGSLSELQKNELQAFCFWFFLYAHPVNGETLEAFSLAPPLLTNGDHPVGMQLIHTESGIAVRDYFQAYHDYYIQHHAEYREQLLLSPRQIRASLKLTLELLDVVEGDLPAEYAPELPVWPIQQHEAMSDNKVSDLLQKALRWIHNPDELLNTYAAVPEDVFALLGDLILYAEKEGQSRAYTSRVMEMLLDNYVLYVLFFDPGELSRLIVYFAAEPETCTLLVNRLLTDTIFMQRILRQRGIHLLEQYPEAGIFMNEQARKLTDF
ncbi:hypothetical protein B9G55_07735 [Saccharibacillus sp. O16]|nr:hypothetical protein B9G55_07735 [Saccharibacillus sp. O16]